MYCLCSLFRRALSSTIATEPLRSIRNPATLPSIIHPNGTIPSGDFLSANRSTLPSYSKPSSLPLPYPYRATPQHLRICCLFLTERFRHTYPSNACPCRVVVLHKPTSAGQLRNFLPVGLPPMPSYTAHILRKKRYSVAPYTYTSASLLGIFRPFLRRSSVIYTYLFNLFYVHTRSFVYTFCTNSLNDLYNPLKGFVRIL